MRKGRSYEYQHIAACRGAGNFLQSLVGSAEQMLLIVKLTAACARGAKLGQNEHLNSVGIGPFYYFNYFFGVVLGIRHLDFRSRGLNFYKTVSHIITR